MSASEEVLPLLLGHIEFAADHGLATCIEVEFSIPFSADASLAVYDNVGRWLETLCNGHFVPGVHYAVWDANDADKGAYWVFLKSKSFAATKRFRLTKEADDKGCKSQVQNNVCCDLGGFGETLSHVGGLQIMIDLEKETARTYTLKQRDEILREAIKASCVDRGEPDEYFIINYLLDKLLPGGMYEVYCG